MFTPSCTRKGLVNFNGNNLSATLIMQELFCNSDPIQCRTSLCKFQVHALLNGVIVSCKCVLVDVLCCASSIGTLSCEMMTIDVFSRCLHLNRIHTDTQSQQRPVIAISQQAARGAFANHHFHFLSNYAYFHPSAA